MTKIFLVLLNCIIIFCFILVCTKITNQSKEVLMNKSAKGSDKKLPIDPDEKELRKIGLVLVSTLEKWAEKDSPDLIKNSKASGFKPFTEAHYIADWYIKKDENILYCGRIGNPNFRYQYEIHSKNVNGKWESDGSVSKMLFHRKH